MEKSSFATFFDSKARMVFDRKVRFTYGHKNSFE